MIIAPSRPTRTPVGFDVVLLVLAVLAGVFAMHALPQVPVRAHAHPATAAATAQAPVATGGHGTGRTFGAVVACGHGADGMPPAPGGAAARASGGAPAGGHAGAGDHADAVAAAPHGEADDAAAGVPGSAVRASDPPVVPAATDAGAAGRAGPAVGAVSAAAAHGDSTDSGGAVRTSGPAGPATPGDRAAQAAAVPDGQRADTTQKGEACARAGHGHGGGHLTHADATCAAAGTSHGPALPALVPVRLAPTGAGPGGPLDGACADRGGRAPPSLSELQLLRI
ncbi:DUF6153 family protein [Streptomyces sp. NPDC086023]|uniref:DUF6153 family protein n=1 Tax=Streptomyces sp. NPDC086023 TaxID=3365746 RepID=UPI0037D483F4